MGGRAWPSRLAVAWLGVATVMFIGGRGLLGQNYRRNAQDGGDSFLASVRPIAVSGSNTAQPSARVETYAQQIQTSHFFGRRISV